MQLERRKWVPEPSENLVQNLADKVSGSSSRELLERLTFLADLNKTIHEKDCFNLNPATNVMNPRAEAFLSCGIGSRPSLGYPGDKYEMGLEAIEEIEVLASSLVAEIFCSKFAEIRVPSGAMANLFSFMAVCKPGDTIIVPPASIGGHVTHHNPGCAGLFGLNIIEAPIDKDYYTVDIDQLRELALRERPKLITLGGSLNLFQHPVSAVSSIAKEVGATLLFDAAHQCGLIAGNAWENPLDLGADVVTMSTYKSLGGPPGGAIVTNNAEIAEKIDSIAFPGMTANFDAAKSAALAVTMLDWKEFGKEYVNEMVLMSKTLASSLEEYDIPIFFGALGHTQSHQFAVLAEEFGGGQRASKLLRKSGFLACGIGLPVKDLVGDMNGLRFGTPELVRWGMQAKHSNKLAGLVAKALKGYNVSEQVSEWRRTFNKIHFVN
ncbi:MAG: aminotransferase class I/II-fold pyridoxal phosphate-dependent enzyme [Paracoccaceae bacterium]|nr:aminotransferase class I/II-fold pyridoxal phosphate-dependent enzyme [Paracoccaceae bacterium]